VNCRSHVLSKQSKSNNAVEGWFSSFNPSIWTLIEVFKKDAALVDITTCRGALAEAWQKISRFEQKNLENSRAMIYNLREATRKEHREQK